MTKSEIKSRLLNGERLENILNFTDGQECIIYKGEWSTGDDVIYIPDTIFNNIWIDVLLDEDEIYDVLCYMYTGKDFMDLADGNEEFAKRLFYYCDWQHPSSALSEIEEDDNEDDEVTDNK